MTGVKDRWMKCCVGSICLLGIVMILGKGYSLVGISNICAIAGILCLNFALYLTAKSLGFYNLIIFGFKKFMEICRNKDLSHQGSKVGEYHEFIANYRHEKNYKKAYIIAGVLIVVSIFTSMGV